MRRFVLAAAVAVAAAAGLPACGSTGAGSSGASAGAGGANASPVSCTRASIQHELYHPGVLTAATDEPAFAPWFVTNTPANGKGYESAVTYAIAARLGFRKSQVMWVKEPFTSAYAPGPKNFDFDINEVSYTPQRATAVTFSASYYPVQQSIVAIKGTPIVTRHSPAELKTYLYGDQIGTTGLTFINTQIQPAATPKVFDTLAEAAAALTAHRIAALVTDTPTAQYMVTAQMKGAVLVGQFRSTGEHFGLVFHQGNPLVTCVNKAIAALSADGQLAALSKQDLQIYNSFPTIRP